jgi:hypothetical protein
MDALLAQSCSDVMVRDDSVMAMQHGVIHELATPLHRGADFSGRLQVAMLMRLTSNALRLAADQTVIQISAVTRTFGQVALSKHSDTMPSRRIDTINILGTGRFRRMVLE